MTPARWGAVAILVILATVAFVLGPMGGISSSEPLAVGSFVVLALTLVALIVYAADTHRIADISHERWEAELLPIPLYEFVYSERKGAVVVRLSNNSKYFVEALVRCNLRVYGEPVEIEPDFDGEAKWLLYPFQITTRTFLLDDVLGRADKNLDDMMVEKNPENRHEQLTSEFEIKFTSELGKTRSSPKRHHFFDFGELRWVVETAGELD